MSSLHEDGMLARANKIKAMFGVQLKEQTTTLPGISREKTGKSYREKSHSRMLTRGITNCDPMLIRLHSQSFACFLQAIDVLQNF